MQFELLQNNLTTPFPDSNYTSERSLNRPRREGSVPMRVQDRRCWVINFMIEWKCKVLNLFQVESIRTSPNRPKVSFEILIKILFVIIILNSFRIHRLRKSRLTHSSSDPNLTKKKNIPKGIYVTDVSPDSPASRAGLRVHDKILQVCNCHLMVHFNWR